MPIAVVLAVLCVHISYGKPFSFSAAERQAQADEDAAREEAQRMLESILDTPCSASLQGQKTAVILAERRSTGGYKTDQSGYGLHIAEINSQLNALGMRTYSPSQIMAQIRAAEIEAYMNNDPDAQLSAASRLGAKFTLRGLVETRVTHNPVADVKEVHVTIGFTLTTASGNVVANISEEAESYAGSDVDTIALKLIQERAAFAVARMYQAYCEHTK